MLVETLIGEIASVLRSRQGTERLKGDRWLRHGQSQGVYFGPSPGIPAGI